MDQAAMVAVVSEVVEPDGDLVLDELWKGMKPSIARHANITHHGRHGRKAFFSAAYDGLTLLLPSTAPKCSSSSLVESPPSSSRRSYQ